jgi:hypothetical protein
MPVPWTRSVSACPWGNADSRSDKRELIYLLLDRLVHRADAAMPTLRVIAQQNRILRSVGSLHERSHLARVRGVHPRVRIAGDEQDRGELRTLLDIVIGRVLV